MLERLALVGFLAGYSGPIRDAYRTDVRRFPGWLVEREVRLLEVRRTHIELYGRWLQEQGRARSTIGRRLSTLAGFYRYCERERILERSLVAHLRRPKQDYESRTLGLDPLGCHRTATTRWRHCCRRTGCGSPKPWARTSAICA
jgi:integrase/recombinase XerD